MSFLYKCTSCQIVFKDKQAFLVHQRDNQKRPGHAEASYKRLAAPAAALDNRKYIILYPSGYACPNCAAQFPLKIEILNHYKKCPARFPGPGPDYPALSALVKSIREIRAAAAGPQTEARPFDKAQRRARRARERRLIIRMIENPAE